MTNPSFLNKQFLPMVWNWTSQSICKSSNMQSIGKSINVISNICLFKLAEKVTLSTGLFYEHLSSTSSLDHPYMLHNGSYAVLFSPFRQTHWTPVICNSECTIVALQCISQYSPKWLQPCLVVTRLVPCETATISLHVLWTPYNCAPIYRVTLFKGTYVGCRGV